MQSPVPVISPQEAFNTCNQSIGPLYHGTSSSDKILEQGFAWEEAETGSANVSHGYSNSNYGFSDSLPPIHHLGFGIYLTQVKSIAKDFGSGSMRSVLEFWVLKSANVEVINFASTNTMMKWWIQNGYNPKLANIDRVAATRILTQNLASKFDAVLFKGKTLYKVLDGNQICIYNPAILRRIDKTLSQSGDIGSKVKRKSDGMMGVLINRRPLSPEQSEIYHAGEKEFLTVKWRKGRQDPNVYPKDVDFL